MSGETEPTVATKILTGIVQRYSKSNEYPDRLPVPDIMTSWDVPFTGYSPRHYDVPRAETPEAKKGDYTDPKDPREVDWSKRQAFGGEIGFDEAGYSQNPLGRTGIAGRGKLNQWGPTLAADPIVTRDGQNGQLELLVVTRADNGLSALPGGKLEVNETNEPIEKPENAAERELLEEAGIIADLADARLIYSGPVDDERNTDNAWMETMAFHVHLSGQEALQNPKPQESDVEFAEWTAITPELLGSLNANIGQIVKLALPREA